jgi:hypothetical protein
MVHPGQQPALVDLIPYTNRPYAAQLAEDRDAITGLLRGDPGTDASIGQKAATIH